MKFVALFLLGVVSLAAQPSAPVPDATRDFEAYQQIYYRQPPEKLSATERMRWVDALMKEGWAAGLAYVEKHPADPRRWDVVLMMRRSQPMFVKDFKPGFEALPRNEIWSGIIADETAKAAAAARLGELLQAMAASTDATPTQRERLDWLNLMESSFGRDGSTPAISAEEATARLLAHCRRYATQVKDMDQRIDRVVGAMERSTPGAGRGIWATFSREAPTEAMKQYAAERLRFLDMQAGNLDFRFTATDGREVDLAKLRGKVVLVDFWATWCGPCIAELPNVIANYKKYHDRGFEVVGIALENAKFMPTDTPEQAAQKLAAANKVLADFTTSRDMPWPQYCDGNYWRTRLATNFSIKAIPAMLLIDQQGRIVSRDAHGEKLEQELKRLLGL